MKLPSCSLMNQCIPRFWLSPSQVLTGVLISFIDKFLAVSECGGFALKYLRSHRQCRGLKEMVRFGFIFSVHFRTVCLSVSAWCSCLLRFLWRLSSSPTLVWIRVKARTYCLTVTPSDIRRATAGSLESCYWPRAAVCFLAQLYDVRSKYSCAQTTSCLGKFLSISINIFFTGWFIAPMDFTDLSSFASAQHQLLRLVPRPAQ